MNELTQKKHAKGTIVEIIDNINFDITSDISNFQGNVYLVVEFTNEQGKKYKVKTPAISKKMYNYVKVGQQVDVYYDDTNKRPSMGEYKEQGKREKVFYDDIDFYVTNIKGEKVSNMPVIFRTIAFILSFIITAILVYMLTR